MRKNKISIIVALVVGAMIIFGTIAAKNANVSDNANGGQTNNSKSDDKYMDAMRKCTVMEAADIFRTGVGGKKNNAFEDARTTCSQWYRDWTEKDFYDAVYEDWENRKTEVVDGHNLEYYLSILGW